MRWVTQQIGVPECHVLTDAEIPAWRLILQCKLSHKQLCVYINIKKIIYLYIFIHKFMFNQGTRLTTAA